jgi:hypothetical protein
MEGKQSSPEIKETVNVNTNAVTNGEKVENRILTAAEVFGIAVLAVIVCVAVAKVLKHHFKKAVRSYAVNDV